MLRGGDLTGGVIRLDDEYYGSRHQAEHPQAADDAPTEEAFFHDFEVGAAIVNTLSEDLEQLREITNAQAENEQTQRLFSRIGIVAPIKRRFARSSRCGRTNCFLGRGAGRCPRRASALDDHAESLGVPFIPAKFSPLPDPDEHKPEEVLAGATTVVRELAAAISGQRGRLTAMKTFADEADEARSSSEDESESLQLAINAVVAAVDERTEGAASEGLESDADSAERLAAVAVALEELQPGVDDATLAAVEELAQRCSSMLARWHWNCQPS